MRIAYTNLVDAATLTASSEDTRYPVENVQNQRLGKVWRTLTASVSTCVVDLLGAYDVDTIAIIGHNLTASATLTIEANTADSWGSPAYSTSLTAIEGAPILKYLTAAQNYEYWRFVIYPNSIYTPVAYYAFDGDATDSSGNGYDGTTSGTSFTTGKYGQAASFNGTTDYVSLPSGAYSVVNETSPFSITAWAKLDTITPTDVFPRVVSIRDASVVAAEIWLNTTTGQWQTVSHNSTGGAQMGTAVAGAWTFLAMSYDGSSLKSYQDGVLIATSSSITATGIVADTGAIGGRSDSPTANSFGGLIDDVRIYDYALSADDVAALFAAKTAPEVRTIDIGRLWLGTYLQLDLSSTTGFTVSKKRSDNVTYGRGRQHFATQGVGWREFSLNFRNYYGTALTSIQTMFDTVGKFDSVIFSNFDTDRSYDIVEPCYVSIQDDLDFGHKRSMHFDWSIRLAEDR